MVRYVVELPAHQRNQVQGGPLGLVMRCLILQPFPKADRQKKACKLCYGLCPRLLLEHHNCPGRAQTS